MTMIKENNLQNQPSSIPVLDELVRLRISWAPEMIQGAFEALQKQVVRVRTSFFLKLKLTDPSCPIQLGPIVDRYRGSPSKRLGGDDEDSDAIITTGSAS